MCMLYLYSLVFCVILHALTTLKQATVVVLGSNYSNYRKFIQIAVLLSEVSVRSSEQGHQALRTSFWEYDPTSIGRDKKCHIVLVNKN